MKETPEKPLGLERVKRWLYDKGLDERGAGCVLCGSCYGHGPVNPMEDEPGFKSKCPTTLATGRQKVCVFVQNNGF